ncbi:hypothetical protein ACFL1L_02855 [Thermoplasmatota archaeon]
MILKKDMRLFTTFIISIIVISFMGCIDSIDDPELPSRGFFMGLHPNPAVGQNIEYVHLKASELSEFIPVWSSGTGANGFWDYADKLQGWWGKTFLKNYIRGNNMFPLIHFSFIDKDQSGNLILKTPDNINNATLNNAEWRALYKLSVIDVVNIVKPAYISLGNEVNRWYEKYGNTNDDPNGFQHYVSLYEEIYDLVKDIKPDTTVFCVFSRKIVEENREANLEVLNMFNESKIDILAFTTYPIAVQGINKPSDIPTDYYLIATQYMPGKPFGFTEIGWPTYELAGGEKAQYDFLINLSSTLTIDQGIPLHLFMYCWLHDIEGGDTNGLINRDGNEKMGYNAWGKISNY